MQKTVIGCALQCISYCLTVAVAVNNVVTAALVTKLHCRLHDSSLSIWGICGKSTKTEIPFPLKSSKSDLQTIFFSHVMLQDADSNAEHVMSSTKLMQSQQTPCSSPSLLNGWVSAIVMESHTVCLQVPKTLHKVKGCEQLPTVFSYLNTSCQKSNAVETGK